MRKLEIFELDAVSGGYGDDDSCYEYEYAEDAEYPEEGGGGGPSPSYVDAKAGGSPASTGFTSQTTADGSTITNNSCITLNAGVVSQQTCVNSDGTTTVMTCVNAGVGAVSVNQCTSVTAPTKQ